MKGLFLILGLTLLVCDYANGCFSTRSQPCIPDLPDPEPIIDKEKIPAFELRISDEKEVEQKVEKVIAEPCIENNTIQLESEILAIFFPVEWTIKNFETLATLGVDQLKSNHFILKNEEMESCKNPQRQCARHIFQMICNPSLDDRQINYLDFKLKKLKFEEIYEADGASWMFNNYPSFGFFNFDTEDNIKFEVFSTDLSRDEETYLGSSTDYETPVNFGIDERDEITFCIHHEDIQSKVSKVKQDLKVRMNLTIFFEV